MHDQNIQGQSPGLQDHTAGNPAGAAKEALGPGQNHSPGLRWWEMGALQGQAGLREQKVGRRASSKTGGEELAGSRESLSLERPPTHNRPPGLT